MVSPPNTTAATLFWHFMTNFLQKPNTWDHN